MVNFVSSLDFAFHSLGLEDEEGLVAALEQVKE